MADIFWFNGDPNTGIVGTPNYYTSGGGAWTWDTTLAPPVYNLFGDNQESGSPARGIPHLGLGDADGHEIYVQYFDTDPEVPDTDYVFAWIYMKSGEVPTQLQLGWKLENTWYRAYWGTDELGWSNAVQISATLPAADQWHRLAVPLSTWSLSGNQTADGFALDCYGSGSDAYLSGVGHSDQATLTDQYPKVTVVEARSLVEVDEEYPKVTALQARALIEVKEEYPKVTGIQARALIEYTVPSPPVLNLIYSYADTDSYDIDANWTSDGAWWAEATNHACLGSTVSPPDGHTNYISSAQSPNTGTPEIYRDIDVSAYATAIDAGGVDFQALVDIATYTGDSGNLAIEFYDVSPAIIGSRTSGTPIDPNCTWTEQELTGDVPANTRTIRLILVATYGAGSYNNAYFSNPRLSLKGYGLDIGDELRSTNLIGEAIVERTADEEVRLTNLLAEGIVEREAVEEVRLTSLYVEAIVDRASGPINHNKPTAIACFA